MQVLGVHRHGADKKYGTAKIVRRIGHHRTERESGKLSRMRRQAADTAERGECAGALRKRWFRNIGCGGSAGAGVGGRHASMVAKLAVLSGSGSTSKKLGETRRELLGAGDTALRVRRGYRQQAAGIAQRKRL